MTTTKTPVAAPLASAPVAIAFTLAGKARLTIRSKKTGTRFTYRVEAKEGKHSCGGWGMLGGMSTLARKLVLARDHVGATGHREWVVQESARRSPGTEADWDHRLGCLDCGFEVWVSMAEIAEEGRLELLDSYGLGAEMEAIKRTPLVERRLAWDLLLDDSR